MGKVSRRRAIELMVGLPLAVVGLATVLDRVVAPLLPGPTLPAGGGATVDELLAAARKACGAPGIGAAILAPLDKVAIHVAGRRERGGEAPVMPDDPWHLGSDGKAMTAAVYARLVEQGRARWGAVVPELFPDLAGTVDPAWRRTTIEDLLAHRAGVTDGPLRFRLLPMHFDGRPADVQRTGLVRLVLGSPPAGDPGAFAYANLSYVIAGAAIERAAGLPFEAATARELFQPLGLTSAGFGAPRGKAPRGHAKPRFLLLGDGPVDPDGFADNPPALSPAGRVHMSLADWARFVAIFLRRGESFLHEASVAKLLAVPGSGHAYALGWARVEGFATPVFAHSGSNTLWFAVAMIVPERGAAVLAAANDGAQGPAAIMGPLARRLLERVLARSP